MASVQSSPLSPADQARIRRERRQAKVREGGNSRLAQITSTQTGNVRALDALTTPTSTPPPAPHADDPPDIDLSDHAHNYPTLSAGTTSRADELRQAAISDPFASPFPGGDPFAAGGMPPGFENDPMMAMLQQMGAAGGPGGAGGAGFPPGMAGLAGLAGMGGMPGMETEEKVDLWAPMWRVAHALCSLALALWVLSSGAYTGTMLDRSVGADAETKPVFWYFVTMELGLQTARYLIEGGQPARGSLIGVLGGFLPAKLRAVVETGARYWGIAGAVGRDAGVFLFVLGVAAWWGQ